jgi:hypothetical protein
LNERLRREFLEHGPYFFPDLADTTTVEEQAAIDAGVIKATRIDWAVHDRNPQRRDPRLRASPFSRRV